MVDFNQFMSVALRKCAPSGEGTGDARQRVFNEMVALWNEEKDTISQMTEAELEEELLCP